MAPILRNRLPTRVGLLATLMAGLLSSCAPQPPMVSTTEPNLRISYHVASENDRSQRRAEDICAIYRSMFPASVIRPLGPMFEDPRLSTRTEAGNNTPAEVRAIRAGFVEATGRELSVWAGASEDTFVRAFRSWRAGPLPDCDWMGFARSVSAPARNGEIGEVLTARESGSYTRVSYPFFIDRDTAIILIREVVNDGDYIKRMLVLTYRDGDSWAIMYPHTFEERFAQLQ